MVSRSHKVSLGLKSPTFVNLRVFLPPHYHNNHHHRQHWPLEANFMSETRLTCFGVKIHWFVCWSKDSNSGTLRASSHGSDSTPESRLFRVRFNPWEPALTGQIQPVRAGSHGSNSTRESPLSRVGFDPWEPALRGHIWPVRAGSHGSEIHFCTPGYVYYSQIAECK